MNDCALGENDLRVACTYSSSRQKGAPRPKFSNSTASMVCFAGGWNGMELIEFVSGIWWVDDYVR